MKAWSRHVVLMTKTRREGRLTHRHNWSKRQADGFDDDFWVCYCGKKITSYQIMAAGDRYEAMRLFLPTNEEGMHKAQTWVFGR